MRILGRPAINRRKQPLTPADIAFFHPATGTNNTAMHNNVTFAAVHFEHVDAKGFGNKHDTAEIEETIRLIADIDTRLRAINSQSHTADRDFSTVRTKNIRLITHVFIHAENRTLTSGNI